MELESLKLANKEREEKLLELRNDVQMRTTPSLHSVHSEDLICLRKIRQLAEEELNLKNCIGQLESKEIMYRRQMNKLLPCKRSQRDDRQMGRAQTFSQTAKKPCCPSNARKCDLLAEMQEKCPLKDKGRVSREVPTMEGWYNLCSSKRYSSFFLCFLHVSPVI